MTKAERGEAYREYQRAYYQAHKEELQKRQREYYLANREKICKAARERYYTLKAERMEKGAGKHAVGGTLMNDKWIPVSERLPEEGTPVLVMRQYERGKFPITYERYDPRSNMWHDGCAQYWFPLPEAPEEDADDE